LITVPVSGRTLPGYHGEVMVDMTNVSPLVGLAMGIWVLFTLAMIALQSGW
jgi:hypothetical protein